jgi:hypothetical protein
VLGSGKGLVDYNPVMERKAVIWLSLQTKKPILRLTVEDYAGMLRSWLASRLSHHWRTIL